MEKISSKEEEDIGGEGRMKKISSKEEEDIRGEGRDGEKYINKKKKKISGEKAKMGIKKIN